jgi:predicted acetyltransferase
MSRAEMSPAVSHGRLAAREAARAKRTLNPTLPSSRQRPPTDRRNPPVNGSAVDGSSVNGSGVNGRAVDDSAVDDSAIDDSGSSGKVASGADRALRRPQAVLPPHDDARVAAHLRNGSSATATIARELRRRRPRRVIDELLPARAGDHPEIYQFLLAVFQGPSREEFHAVQDQPTYDPGQRLLVKREGRIAAHLQLSHSGMCFGDLRLGMSQIHWLGTLPEFRSQGYATRLLHRADQEMRGAGAIIGCLRTRVPQFFRQFGWAVCGRHSASQAKARDVLARLSAEPGTRPPLSIRLWRHVELPSLMRVYSQNTLAAYGPLERSEAYWRWLISRKAFDHIIVAIHGRDRMELVDTNAPIVGYAVVRQGRVDELLASPDFPHAAVQILARACGDSIERNRHTIEVETLPGDPLHRLMVEAGGTTNASESDGGEVQMVKILDPAAFVKAIEPVLVERARAANLPPDSELGLFVDGVKRTLTVTRRGARLTTGRLGRSYLALKGNEFTRLLLGHNDVTVPVEQERIVPSTQIALETARALFPRLPLWRPTWDEALA